MSPSPTGGFPEHKFPIISWVHLSLFHFGHPGLGATTQQLTIGPLLPCPPPPPPPSFLLCIFAILCVSPHYSIILQLILMLNHMSLIWFYPLSHA